MKRLLLIPLVLGTVLGGEGPCHPEQHGDLLPDPKNCSSFYQCVWGRSVQLVCPGNLHFNSKIRVCDWPANAQCGVGEPTQPPEPADDSEEPEHGERGPCNSQDDGLLIPDPESCSSFYHCNHGESIKSACPTGLHFNSAQQLCDWPANVGCEEGSGDGSGDGNPIINTSEPDGAETQEQSGDENSEESNQSGSCGNIAHGDLTPDPRDCGQYYHCVWGKNVHMPCPNGLHFNPSLKVCDMPFQAQCKVDILEDSA